MVTAHAYTQVIRPRFYETDAQGHINNVTIAGWFEVTRMGWMGSLGAEHVVGPRNWILASVQIDYLAETFFGSDVELKVPESTVGNSSLTVQGEMWQNAKQTMRGKAVLVHMDSETRRTQRIPEELRELIRSHAA